MNCGTKPKILLLICLLLFAIAGRGTASTIIYVDDDATGANDGSSWANAYKYLQDALADANSAPKPIEIRVAQGTYKPDEDTANPDGTGDREAAFQLINEVALKGAYAGPGSPDPNDRNIELYETILSGDLNGNDGPNFANNKENSYHIFYHVEDLNLDDTAILDGFTITAGNAKASWPHSSGGGMCNYRSSPTVNNCTFTANSADWYGGGMYNGGSSPTVNNCTFTVNSADDGGGILNSGSSPTIINTTFGDNSSAGRGGGISNWYLSSPTVNNCTFIKNSAMHEGGGMDNYKSSPTVNNCTFTANSTNRLGGGMYNNQSNPTVDNCTFSENAANRYGGAMANRQSSPTVDNCTFSENAAIAGGGGMYNSSSSPELINCVFSNNSGGSSGGAIANYDDSSPLLTNCTLSENTANYGGGMHNSDNSSPILSNCRFTENSAWGGGGMFNDGGSPIISSSIFIRNSAIGKYGDGGGMHNKESSPVLINCTFNGNFADRYGGAMNTYRYAAPTIRNCILWGNTPEEIYVYGRGPVVTFSNVQGGWTGEGNFDLAPKFMDTLGGDIHLLPDSPCVNAGDPCSVVGADAVDIDGEKRVMLGRVDMGADEFYPFLAEFVVVRRERVDRTVFEYECEVVLQNVSRFDVNDIRLEMAQWPGNMTIVDPNISFGGTEIGPGESATSIDTCTFRVDRSKAINSAEIIWHVTAEMAKTGAKMNHTVSTPLPPKAAGFDGLKDLAAQWLWQGTAGGIDEDSAQDGTVNLADFAKFALQWMK